MEEVKKVEDKQTQKTAQETAVAEAPQSVDEAETVVEEIPARIRQLNADELTIDERVYKVLTNYHDGLDLEMFNERFSDVLNKYDYIVGDIGFEQLRLKGFYDNSRKKAALDQRINALEDYLYEYCNFGCAYFVIEKVNKDEPLVDKKPAHIKEKKGKVKNSKPQVKRNKTNTTNKNQKNEQDSKTSHSKKKTSKNQKATPKNKKNQKGANEKVVERPFTIRRKEDKK